MATVLAKQLYVGGSASGTSSDVSLDEKTKEPSSSVRAITIPALGVAGEEKRFWFQRSKVRYDPNAIATQVSTFFRL
jgi:hypothetical protein